MASQKNKKIYKANEDISRFKLGEIGATGLPVFNGVSLKELKSELRHPESIKTYKLMNYHPSINSCINLYQSMIAKVRYRFIPPKNATEEELKQTKIVESMFSDMEHSLEDFISEALTCMTYGWSVCEKVYRKRTTSTGSIYDDGLIGLRKIALREQESIYRFIFDSTGNNVIGVEQNLNSSLDPYGRWSSRVKSQIIIPRSKFMLFTLGDNRSDPYGTSPLKNVFIPWRYLQALEELEAQSVVKDVNGLPILSIPPQYMSADASPEQKTIFENFKNILRNLQQGSQSAVILPNVFDPDTRQSLFKLELLTQDGKKNFDLNSIKEYYKSMIFIGLGADILLLGNTKSGSFALGSLKNSIAASRAESFIKKIVQIINTDLISQIYELNGFNLNRKCVFDYETIENIDLETYSKAIQRMKSVALIPSSVNVVNSVLDSIGVDPLPEETSQEELDKVLGENVSRAGDGFKTAGDGTSNNNNFSNDFNLENV